MLSADAAADALVMRTACASKGNKKRLLELTRVARTAAILETVRTMRMQNTANPLGGSARSGEGS